MMDFDYSWKEPSEAQIAAWEKACDVLNVIKEDREFMRERHHTMVMMEANRRAYAVDADIFSGPAHEMTPYTLAEMILQADGSLWYTQAKAWAEGNFPDRVTLDEGSKKVFMAGAKALTLIVESGYQDGTWWDLETIWPDPKVRATNLLFLVDLCKAFRGLAGRGMIMVSAGFTYIPLLLLPRSVSVSKVERALASGQLELIQFIYNEMLAAFDPDFRRKWRKAERKVKAQIHEEYEPTTCIHPECDNLVAPKGIKPRKGHYKNYRGTGACQQGHNSYYCTKCKKPHSHTSKVGKAHYEKHNGGDFTAEMSAKWKAGEL